MTLAQLSAVPDSALKTASLLLLALLGAIALAVGIWANLRSGPKRVNVEPQPLEVRQSVKRYNHDRNESLHADHARRLDGHDAALDSLWTTMRSEDASIREKTSYRFEQIAKSLGRIEGRLGIQPPAEET